MVIQTTFHRRTHLKRRRSPVDFPVVKASAADSQGHVETAKSLGERFPALVTGFFFFIWYFLNVIFNILNKKVYNYFPYPYFVSVVHLLVGVVYCLVSWSVGLPKRAAYILMEEDYTHDGSHDGGEQQNVESNAKKKSNVKPRGPAKGLKHKPRVVKQVEWDDLDRPVGEWSTKFATIGYTTRSKVSILINGGPMFQQD